MRARKNAKFASENPHRVAIAPLRGNTSQQPVYWGCSPPECLTCCSMYKKSGSMSCIYQN